MAAIVVGDERDPHTAAVTDGLSARGCPHVVLDAASLSSKRWRYDGDRTAVRVGGRWLAPERGWLRRLAPPGEHDGIPLGSREAAEIGARLSFLAALSDSCIRWLSSYWAVARAENKLVQYAAARRIGVPVPHTEVVGRPTDLGAALGEQFVIKPLGVGDFVRDGVSYAVHTTVVRRDDEALYSLAEAPFIAQAFVKTVTHLRVVTVGGRAWSASLDAAGLPVDWRTVDDAHTAWRPSHHRSVQEQALAVADTLHLGYTSQDWLLDVDGIGWFVDGNAGGQWLFLPDAVADPVTDAIVSWLAGDDDW